MRIKAKWGYAWIAILQEYSLVLQYWANIPRKVIDLIPTAILVALTKRNYRLRRAGKKPDRWYWADRQLVKRGYFEYNRWNI